LEVLAGGTRSRVSRYVIREWLDPDDDGVLETDNCTSLPNADQRDADQDGRDDVCDDCPCGGKLSEDGLCIQCDEIDLVTDRDGSILLVTSSSSQSIYAVARVVFEGATPKVERQKTSSGRLAAPPIADLTGLRLVRPGADLGTPQLGPIATNLSPTSLPRVRTGWKTLAETVK
jgi:hypothetical protein